MTDNAVAKNAVPLEVVDGQQRIISCRLIYHALQKILRNITAATSYAVLDDADCTLQLAATAGKSRAITMRHITDNYILATQLPRGMQESGNTNDDLILFADFFLHHCRATRFATDKLDEAFQMFDSQNSRGKALDPDRSAESVPPTRDGDSKHSRRSTTSPRVNMGERPPPRIRSIPVRRLPVPEPTMVTLRKCYGSSIRSRQHRRIQGYRIEQSQQSVQLIEDLYLRL